MSQKRNNIILLISFVAISMATAVIYLTGGDTRSSGIKANHFALGENTIITDVVFERNSGTQHFKYEFREWRLNDEFKIDVPMRDALFAILSTINVRIPVAKGESDSIASHIRESGVLVRILNNGQEVLSYYAGGDEERRITYMMDTDSDQPYVVNIPGYNSYIGAVFFVEDSEWRNRRVFNAEWATLNEYMFDYRDENQSDILVVAESEFFRLDGVAEIDTNRMMSYLESIIFLQTDGFLEDETVKDSLMSTEPFATVSVSDLRLGKSTLDIYLPASDGMETIGVLDNSQLLRFNTLRLKNLLKSRDEITRQSP